MIQVSNCLKRKKLSWQLKKSEENENKMCLEKKMIDTSWESNVNTVVEEHFTSENRHSDIVVDEKVLKYH